MAFGHWETVESLPAFAYTADQDTYEPATWDPIMAPPTNRHWNHVGNQRITLVADNAGLSGLFDSHDGYLWITHGRPFGDRIGHAGVVNAGSARLCGKIARCVFMPTCTSIRNTRGPAAGTATSNT